MTRSALDRARRYQGELSAIGRDLYAPPELGLEECCTADLVARKPEEKWGIEVGCGFDDEAIPYEVALLGVIGEKTPHKGATE